MGLTVGAHADRRAGVAWVDDADVAVRVPVAAVVVLVVSIVVVAPVTGRSTGGAVDVDGGVSGRLGRAGIGRRRIGPIRAVRSCGGVDRGHHVRQSLLMSRL